MPNNNYNDIVMEHYNQVAKEDGASPLSTMKDAYTRELETNSILDIVKFKRNECVARLFML